MICIIAAAAHNNVIGSDGKIPWNIEADRKHFKCLTTGHVIIMGRRTFEEIGRPLPGRTNAVITSSKVKCGGIEVFTSLNQALEKYKNQTVFICGGERLYKEALPLADKIYLTEIDLETEGDRFFPEFDSSKFTRKITGEAEGVKFIEYERVSE